VHLFHYHLVTSELRDVEARRQVGVHEAHVHADDQGALLADVDNGLRRAFRA